MDFLGTQFTSELWSSFEAPLKLLSARLKHKVEVQRQVASRMTFATTILQNPVLQIACEGVHSYEQPKQRQLFTQLAVSASVKCDLMWPGLSVKRNLPLSHDRHMHAQMVGIYISIQCMQAQTKPQLPHWPTLGPKLPCQVSFLGVLKRAPNTVTGTATVCWIYAY